MINSRLHKKYQEQVAPQIAKDFEIKNSMAVPAVKKVVINMGVGDVMKNKEVVESLKKDLKAITGQAPSVRLAKISVAGFGIRRGMPVGLAVTLRAERMYSFLDRLISIVLPRLRDFRGVSSKSFDGVGNYSIGLSEHTIFPEIDFAKAAPSHGIEITVVTN